MASSQSTASICRVPDEESDQLVTRIRKLRWMGMEEDARRLQLSVSRDQVAILRSEPSETD
jgi:hypothetical protein